MTSRIFSINLDDVTFAKLGELQNKYPDKSRNAIIRHIIHVVHSGEYDKTAQLEKDVEHLTEQIKDLCKTIGIRNTTISKLSRSRSGLK